MKLNPPLLESFIPAFTNEGPIIIPFEMNPSVHYDQVKGFKIKLTNVINDGLSKSYIELNSTSFSNSDNNYIVSVEFNDSNKDLIKTLAINNTYHIQLAYVDHNDQVGLYSTAALVKYTIKPNITIRPIGGNGFESVYETEDLNEGVYDYQFTITNENGQMIDDSNTLIHNSSTNEILKQSDQSMSSFNGTISTPKEKNTVNFSSGSDQWYKYKIEQTALYTFDCVTTPYTFYILSNDIDTTDDRLSSGYDVIYDKCFKNMTESYSLTIDSGRYVLINQPLKDNTLLGTCKVGSYNLYLKSNNILSIDDSAGDNIYYYDLQGDEQEISATQGYYALNENNILTSNSFGMEYMSLSEKNTSDDYTSTKFQNVKQVVSNSPISVTLKPLTLEPIMRIYSEGSIQDYSWYGEKNEDNQLYLYRKTGIYSKPIKYWYNYTIQLTRPNTYTIEKLLYSQDPSWNDCVYIMESDEYDYFTKNFDATARVTSVNINSDSATITVEKDKPVYIIVCRNMYDYNDYDNEFHEFITSEWAYITNLVRPIEHGVYNSESGEYEWHINHNHYSIKTVNDKNVIELTAPENVWWYNYSIKAPDNAPITIQIQKNNDFTPAGEVSDIKDSVFFYRISSAEYSKCEKEDLKTGEQIFIQGSDYVNLRAQNSSKTITLEKNEYLLISIHDRVYNNLSSIPFYIKSKGVTPLLTNLNHYHYGNLEENSEGKSWYPINNTSTSYINLIYNLPYKGSIHLSNLDDNDWVSIGYHSSDNKFIIVKNYSHLRGQSDIYIDTRDINIEGEGEPVYQLLVNTKNQNWKQNLNIKFYEQINSEPTNSITATPGTVNIDNCIPNKTLSADDNYVLIKNIGLDTTNNYKYIFDPRPLTESMSYTITPFSEDDVIYCFSNTNVLNSADVYTAAEIGNPLKKLNFAKNDQIIIVSNFNKAPTITCKAKSSDNNPIQLSTINYTEGQVIIDKGEEQPPVYYYHNENSYPQVVTLNHVLPEDSICITKYNPSDETLRNYDTEFYDNVNSTQNSYSVNVPSDYYLSIYNPGEGNEDCSILYNGYIYTPIPIVYYSSGKWCNNSNYYVVSEDKTTVSSQSTTQTETWYNYSIKLNHSIDRMHIVSQIYNNSNGSEGPWIYAYVVSADEYSKFEKNDSTNIKILQYHSINLSNYGYWINNLSQGDYLIITAQSNIKPKDKWVINAVEQKPNIYLHSFDNYYYSNPVAGESLLNITKNPTGDVNSYINLQYNIKNIQQLIIYGLSEDYDDWIYIGQAKENGAVFEYKYEFDTNGKVTGTNIIAVINLTQISELNDNDKLLICTKDSKWRERIHIRYGPTTIVPSKLRCTNKFTSYKVLDTEQQYTVDYKVSTLNQLKKSTKESFSVTSILEPTNTFDLNTRYNQDGAYIQVDGVNISNFVPGMYQLLRANSKDRYAEWTPIKSFKAVFASDISFKDYTVEQGISYRYAYQQYNKHGIHSYITSITEPIYVDFEYMYLGDKDRQIKLSFNSKVTSFKSTLFENKLDTLGGRYPFFFKNGDQNYKEFPISGLLSYHLDEAETFMSREKLGLSENSFDRLATNSLVKDLGNVATINQTGYNFTAERLFRLELLDWLNDGQEKLFRSPAEGNYVVRLMNVNLTPNEQLSRLVSEFSATAYECGSAELADIVAAGRLVDTTEQEVYTAHVDSQSINNLMDESKGIIKLNNGEYFSSIKITGAFPSSIIKLYRVENTQTITDGNANTNNTLVATYTIGMTGILDARDLPAANKIEYTPAAECRTGMLEYWFTKDASIDSNFDSIVEVQVKTTANTYKSGDVIDLTNVVQIYTLIVEPTDPSQPAQIQVNGKTIEFNSVQYLDPSSMNITKLSIVKNAMIHMYYKTRIKIKEGEQ